MIFYQQAFGGELHLLTVEESVVAKDFPDSFQKNILQATLQTGKLHLIASDIAPQNEYIKSNIISLALNCDSRQEIETYFRHLSNGGQVLDPLQPQFHGDLFGALMDKYGVNWILNQISRG